MKSIVITVCDQFTNRPGLHGTSVRVDRLILETVTVEIEPASPEHLIRDVGDELHSKLADRHVIFWRHDRVHTDRQRSDVFDLSCCRVIPSMNRDNTVLY